MSEESKIVDAEGAGEAPAESSSAPANTAIEAAKAAAPGVDLSQPVGKLDKKTMDQIIKSNPSLRAETQGMNPAALQKMLETMKLQDLLAGMATGKNAKDMANYKFWQTQPVPRFDEAIAEEGIIRPGDIDKVSKEPMPLLDDFEWSTIDMEDGDQVNEVYTLLNGHYVEDDEAMFRFSYSSAFFNWALKPPGWKKNWNIGVRVKSKDDGKKGRLVAFISSIPITLRVRKTVIPPCSEVNFLCIHKKLRGKRLAPVLIREATRVCGLDGYFQGLYTGGAILPTPVSSCRYYHRSLDWLKLHEVGFSPLPPNSTKTKQIARYALPKETKTSGLRLMEQKDVAGVTALLAKYLGRFDLAPEFSEEEVEHWFLHKDGERVIWTYVVEDRGKITDFFNFYALESSVIGNAKHSSIKAAYMYYYASEAAFGDHKDNDAVKKALKQRLNELVYDALVIAKGLGFDVFNALTLLDNVLFLQEQKFGAGDGQLHYYLYNYRTGPIRGGMNDKMGLDEKHGSGIGLVML